MSIFKYYPSPNELPNENDEQAGFRRRRGTADMLCCIQNVIEKTLLMSERTLIVFIDYTKDFDSINHIQMFFSCPYPDV